MADVCEICGKGRMAGNNISHAHNKTKTTWKPNLQTVKAIVEGRVKKIRVCTRCIRSGAVTKAA